MKQMTYRSLVIAVLAAIALTVPIANAAADGPEPEREAFLRNWWRTDKPVFDEQVNRTWMWGPYPFTELVREPYAESPDGYRTVQYYDKARMEITHPEGDDSNPWYVTNGLLVNELVTGKMQVGDQSFIDRQPADINVAGDLDDPDGPTYAQLARLLGDPAIAPGMPINLRLDRDGNVTIDRDMTAQGVTAAYLSTDGTYDHSIASVFWQFMNSTGTVLDYQTMELEQDKLFEHPFYATGLPITEAYWTTVRVGGIPQDVLLQCFERRCLTYTPGNPDGWKVEAGNVGQHYYKWRQGKIAFSTYLASDDAEIVVANGDGSSVVRVRNTETYDNTIAWSPDGQRFAYSEGRNVPGDIFIMNADGTGKRNLTNDPDHYYNMSWSPDGTQIAFAVSNGDFGEIHVVNADGSDRRFLRAGTQPAWSPDGAHISYTAVSEPTENLEYDLFVMNADGSNPVNLTNDPEWDGAAVWSPDGTQIAFVHAHIHTSDIVVINADGTELRQLTDLKEANYAPVWSPMGDRIAFASNRDGNDELYVINPDGSDETRLTTYAGTDTLPAWSPDGSRLAFISDRDGYVRVHVMPATGGEATPLLADTIPGGEPTWTP